MAGVPIMISCAAIRPPPTRFIKVCEITALKLSDIMARTMSFSAAGNTSTIRSMVLAAELVCRVPNTKCPVSAAVKAKRIVSRSRISPTSTTSGSSRLAEAQGIPMHFALIDQTTLAFMHELDRILDGYNVVRPVVVAVIDHTGQSGGLTGPGGSGNQHQAAGKHA